MPMMAQRNPEGEPNQRDPAAEEQSISEDFMRWLERELRDEPVDVKAWIVERARAEPAEVRRWIITRALRDESEDVGRWLKDALHDEPARGYSVAFNRPVQGDEPAPRFSLTLDLKAAERLDRLAGDGQAKAELIGQALALEDLYRQVTAQGGCLLIRRSDGSIAEVERP
jgi:hypothetical protein